MPEVVSDWDDTCAPSRPPFLTLIFQVCCSGHFWILGKVKLLGANENSKGLFFHLHDTCWAKDAQWIKGSKEIHLWLSAFVSGQCLSMCRHKVWQWNQIHSLTVYYINGALFILVLPIRGDPFNQATQKSFISLLVMYLVYSFCIWKDFFKNVK